MLPALLECKKVRSIYKANAKAATAASDSAARLLKASPLAADWVVATEGLGLALPPWVPGLFALLVSALPVPEGSEDCVALVRDALGEESGVDDDDDDDDDDDELTFEPGLEPELPSDERYQFSTGSFMHSPMVTAL
jgi:hypothetical protein